MLFRSPAARHVGSRHGIGNHAAHRGADDWWYGDRAVALDVRSARRLSTDPAATPASLTTRLKAKNMPAAIANIVKSAFVAQVCDSHF